MLRKPASRRDSLHGGPNGIRTCVSALRGRETISTTSRKGIPCDPRVKPRRKRPRPHIRMLDSCSRPRTPQSPEEPLREHLNGNEMATDTPPPPRLVSAAHISPRDYRAAPAPPRGAYDALGRAGPGPGITLAHCWADARRQFIEAGRIIRSRAGRCSTSSASSTPSSG